MNSSALHVQVAVKEGVRDARGERIAADAERHLGIRTGKVRTSKVYSIRAGIEHAQLGSHARGALGDGIVHEVRTGDIAIPSRFKRFVAVGKRPGVTDDEGRTIEETLADVLGVRLDSGVQQVFSRDVFAIEHPLGEQDLRRLAEELLGNPLVHHLSWGAIEEYRHYVPGVGDAVDDTCAEIDLDLSDVDLAELSRRRVLSLSVEEMRAIRDHYRDGAVQQDRAALGLPAMPTECELEVFAQTWSEHCKHKEFNAVIDYTDRETGETRRIDSLFRTYIAGATDVIRQRLQDAGHDWLVKVFSDNAGLVRIDRERFFVWKVETHNTPSALDPYGGALTGILGCNRDPLGTGRGGARILFNTNVLCFAPPSHARPLLPGQLHPRRVFAGVRQGIEDGGNKSGIPTVNGSLVFDDRFAGKPLVFCGTGAIMPSRYRGRDTSEKEIVPGDRILMAGGRVGRDGIHGATFSSLEINRDSPRSAVQIGSPITQKRLSDFLEVACREGLVRCTTDNGAGGLSSSVGELAPISGGAVVHLEQVPLKYAGVKPWEIFVSESQERMTLAVAPQDVSAVLDLAAKYDVEVAEIGVFTDTGVLEVRYEERSIARFDLTFLHHGLPRKRLQAIWEAPREREPQLPAPLDYEKILLQLLGSLNICSRESVIRQYDHEVKGRTVVKPLMGPRGRAPQDAAVLRLGFDYDDYSGLAVSNGILPRYGDLDPYHMSAGAFDEAVRQIIAVGGRLPDLSDHASGFWSVNDNFCVPDSAYDPDENPDGKLKLGRLVRMCEALYDISLAYNVPMTSGKDSMKNDFRANGVRISVPPTVLYSAVAHIEDVRKTTTTEFKCVGDLVYVVGSTHDELGGSEFYRLFGVLGANVPRVRPAEAAARYRRMARANAAGLLASCHDLSDGGLAVALAESVIGGTVGVSIDLPADDEPGDGKEGLRRSLFSESHSRFLVSVPPESVQAFELLMGDDAQRIGEVMAHETLTVRRSDRAVIDLPASKLVQAWRGKLE